MPKSFKLQNGSVLISTEAPGGIYNSTQLVRIAELCESGAALVKATEDQRLALFVKEEEIESVSSKLQEVGLGFRDYQSGIHQPTACLGELCPEHQQDALGAALSITEQLKEVQTKRDTPLRIGINGCATCCVPCHTLDLSILGEDSGYKVSIGGKNQQIPEMASYIAEGIPSEELPELVEKVIHQFNALKEEDETLQDVIERCGMSPFVEVLAPYSQDAADDGDPFGLSGDSEPELGEEPEPESLELETKDEGSSANEELELEDDSLDQDLSELDSSSGLEGTESLDSLESADLGPGNELNDLSPNDDLSLEEDQSELNELSPADELESEQSLGDDIPIENIEGEDELGDLENDIEIQETEESEEKAKDLSEESDELELPEESDELELSEESDELELSEESDELELSEESDELELPEESDELDLSEVSNESEDNSNLSDMEDDLESSSLEMDQEPKLVVESEPSAQNSNLGAELETIASETLEEENEKQYVSMESVVREQEEEDLESALDDDIQESIEFGEVEDTNADDRDAAMELVGAGDDEIEDIDEIEEGATSQMSSIDDVSGLDDDFDDDLEELNNFDLNSTSNESFDDDELDLEEESFSVEDKLLDHTEAESHENVSSISSQDSIYLTSIQININGEIELSFSNGACLAIAKEMIVKGQPKRLNLQGQSIEITEIGGRILVTAGGFSLYLPKMAA